MDKLEFILVEKNTNTIKNFATIRTMHHFIFTEKNSNQIIELAYTQEEAPIRQQLREDCIKEYQRINPIKIGDII